MTHPFSRPQRAAAVLTAETDLQVSLRDVLRGGSNRAKDALPSVMDASQLLCDEATRLADVEEGKDDQSDTRDLFRLVRAVQVCVEFLLQAFNDQATPESVTAASACARVVAAFAHVRSGAIQQDLARVLLQYVSKGVNDKDWSQMVREDFRGVIPAMHLLLEAGASLESVVETASVLLAAAEWYADLGLRARGAVAEGAWAVVELTISVISMAIGQRIEKTLIAPMKQLRDKVTNGGMAAERACADIGTVLERLEAG